jgi:hypothetical protein
VFDVCYASRTIGNESPLFLMEPRFIDQEDRRGGDVWQPRVQCNPMSEYIMPPSNLVSLSVSFVNHYRLG